MMTNKQIEERLDWLTQTVIKIAKNCNVKIDKEISDTQETINNEILNLQATIIDLEYQRLMEMEEDNNV